MKVFVAVLSGVLAAAMAAPAELPAGVLASDCVNYPFCGPSPDDLAANPGLAIYQQGVALTKQQAQTLQPVLPIGVEGLGAHQAAVAKQLALMGLVPGTIVHAGEVARVVQAQNDLIAFGEKQAAAAAAAAASAPIAPAPIAPAPIAPAPVAPAPIAPAPVAPIAPVAPVVPAPIAPTPAAVVPEELAPEEIAPVAAVAPGPAVVFGIDAGLLL